MPILDMGCHAFVVPTVVIRYRLYANLQVRFFQLLRKWICTAQGWRRVYATIEAMLMGIGLWVMMGLSLAEVGKKTVVAPAFIVDYLTP